jgi:hypothetical protein
MIRSKPFVIEYLTEPVAPYLNAHPRLHEQRVQDWLRDQK